MRYFKSFALFYLFCAVKLSSASSCGKPGHSRKSVLIDAENREIFDEGSTVEYDCEHTPIGDFVRTCEDGKWSGSIPKCRECFHHISIFNAPVFDNIAEPINVTELSVKAVTTTRVYFNWKEKMRIVGLQLALRRPSHQLAWPEIEVKRIDGLRSRRLGVGKVHNENLQLVQTFTYIPDVRDIDHLNEVIVKTNNQIANCAVNAQGQLVSLDANMRGPYLCIDEYWCELYYLDETIDDCDTPDTPPNVRNVSTFRTGTVLHANYECEKGYRLKLPLSHERPSCPVNGDWKVYDFKPCEQVLCNKDETNFVIVSVDKSATFGSHFPVGTKGFLSCSTSRDQRYVVCDENGVWLPQTDLCDTPFFKNDGLVIGLVVALGLLVIFVPIIGYWLYHSTKRWSVDVDSLESKPERSENELVTYANTSHPYYEPISYECVDYDETETHVIAQVH
ncbi:hypothetical protein HDE_10881 [Halotydeus destructor]|nr:hypothetical protein HDE_10881 [Halotydeus destructor]